MKVRASVAGNSGRTSNMNGAAPKVMIGMKSRSTS
jgi:hypothetical protein